MLSGSCVGRKRAVESFTRARIKVEASILQARALVDSLGPTNRQLKQFACSGKSRRRPEWLLLQWLVLRLFLFKHRTRRYESRVEN